VGFIGWLDVDCGRIIRHPAIQKRFERDPVKREAFRYGSG
jgi:hypothetical protein